MRPAQLAQLKEKLRPIAHGLPLEGADVESFRRLLEKIRQRPVYLLPFALGPEVLGLWIATDTADYIFYEHSASPYHQRHIVLHEGSHILRGHRGRSLPDLVFSLTRHLDRKLVRALLCHSAFDDSQEAEAEVLATLIEERLERLALPRLRRGSERSAQGIARFLREVQ